MAIPRWRALYGSRWATKDDITRKVGKHFLTCFQYDYIRTSSFDWKANIQAMQIINHKERDINYSIKPSYSRINVGTREVTRGLPAERQNKKGIGNYPVSESHSCGPPHPKLSKTTAVPRFHLSKFKDDFGNTWFSPPNSLGLCTSLVWRGGSPSLPASLHFPIPFLSFKIIIIHSYVSHLRFEVSNWALWSPAITNQATINPGEFIIYNSLNKLINRSFCMGPL